LEAIIGIKEGGRLEGKGKERLNLKRELRGVIIRINWPIFFFN